MPLDQTHTSPDLESYNKTPGVPFRIRTNEAKRQNQRQLLSFRLNSIHNSYV